MHVWRNAAVEASVTCVGSATLGHAWVPLHGRADITFGSSVRLAAAAAAAMLAWTCHSTCPRCSLQARSPCHKLSQTAEPGSAGRVCAPRQTHTCGQLGDEQRYSLSTKLDIEVS